MQFFIDWGGTITTQRTKVDPETLFRIVDVAGVVANALLGAAVARARGFDIIGFLILAIISGLGGGMMRDALLGTGFPVALTDPLYLSSAVTAALIAHFLDLTGDWARRSLIAADALVLGCWSATGAAKALAAGLDALPAVFLGVLTTIGGSMLRDVMVNQIPSVFGGNPLYATISVVGSTEMVIMQRLGHFELGMGISILLCFALAITARWRRWVLPSAARLTVSFRKLPPNQEPPSGHAPSQDDLETPPAEES